MHLFIIDFYISFDTLSPIVYYLKKNKANVSICNFNVLQSFSENKITIENIQKTVCNNYKISKNEMLSPRRSRYLVRPRQIAMYLAKTLTSKSLPDIGREFSNRDHTTVIHSVKKIEKLLKTDENLNKNLEKLKSDILYNKKDEI